MVQIAFGLICQEPAAMGLRWWLFWFKSSGRDRLLAVGSWRLTSSKVRLLRTIILQNCTVYIDLYSISNLCLEDCR